MPRRNAGFRSSSNRLGQRMACVLARSHGSRRSCRAVRRRHGTRRQDDAVRLRFGAEYSRHFSRTDLDGAFDTYYNITFGEPVQQVSHFAKPGNVKTYDICLVKLILRMISADHWNFVTRTKKQLTHRIPEYLRRVLLLATAVSLLFHARRESLTKA